MLASEDLKGSPALTPVGQGSLEDRVLEAMMGLADAEPYGPLLRRQIGSKRVTRRQLSGVGFFLEFDTTGVPAFPDCEGRLPLVVYGQSPPDVLAGFILFMDRPGHAAMLEGFTYSGDWPADVTDMTLMTSLEESLPQ